MYFKPQFLMMSAASTFTSVVCRCTSATSAHCNSDAGMPLPGGGRTNMLSLYRKCVINMRKSAHPSLWAGQNITRFIVYPHSRRFQNLRATNHDDKRTQGRSRYVLVQSLAHLPIQVYLQPAQASQEKLLP